MDLCSSPFVLKAIYIIKILVNALKIIIPLLLIVIVIIDVLKYVLDPDKSKNVFEISLKRFISAVVIFLVPTIVSAFFNLFASNTQLVKCFNNANKSYINQRVLEEKKAIEESEIEKMKKYEEDVERIEANRKRQEEERKRQEELDKQLRDVELIDSNYAPKPLKKNGVILNKNITVNYYSGSKSFAYWLYVPDKLTTNLPIILFLHGLGLEGNDYLLDENNNNQGAALTYGPIAEVKNYGYSYNAIIIHAQVPSNNSVYGYLPTFVELLDKISENYKANKNKISVMGFSHGCYGIMNLIPSYQTYFSAAVPIGCNPKDRARFFVSTPTWTFVGAGDGVGSMQVFVDQINSMGGTAKHSNAPYKAHNIVGDEYSILRDDNYNVIDWMISQTRT